MEQSNQEAAKPVEGRGPFSGLYKSEPVSVPQQSDVEETGRSLFVRMRADKVVAEAQRQAEKDAAAVEETRLAGLMETYTTASREVRQEILAEHPELASRAGGLEIREFDAHARENRK